MCQPTGTLPLLQLDPSVWGAHSFEFRLRPLAEYAEKNIGFSEFASRPGDESWMHARSCPGKDLGIALMDGFIGAYARMGRTAAANGRGQWRPCDPKTGVRMQPEQIVVSTYGVNSNPGSAPPMPVMQLMVG
mmetsp:Transcript_46623/g.105120  ORF Transcript_46623/g.105120 Transcript_46623/m.105120 type:complete len:132 (-) Transcript_46623:423-818(-)